KEAPSPGVPGSTRNTRCPSRCSHSAAHSPTIPPPMTPTRRPLSAAIAAPSARLRMPEEEWWPYTNERGSRGAFAELYRRRFGLWQAVLWRNPRCACQLFLSPAGSANIVEAAFGCGRGFHPNHWGRCVPSRYGYYRGWHDRYYGGGYERPWRHRYNYGY